MDGEIGIVTMHEGVLGARRAPEGRGRAKARAPN